MVNPIKFGTDGWRGIIAEDFTFANVRVCAQAVAEYLKQDGLDKQGLVIGYDTRFASEDFAAAAAEVLAGNDIRVHLCLNPAPTPVVSFTVPATKSVGGIVMTASHNPGSWNGFKYRSQDGASAPEGLISRIEENIASISRRGIGVKRLALDKALKKGVVDYVAPSPVYFAHLSRLVDVEKLRRQKLNIAVDSMYGAGIGYFKEVLQGGDLRVNEINGERNPSFPNIQPEPIARNLAKLSRSVVARKADVGLATDGDADRIGIIDEKGQFLTQHQVFALLCLYLLEVRGERGAIVRTLTSTMMLSRLGKLFDVPVYETPVGFKYVAPLMTKKKAVIGGEESGGYGFRGHVPERDAILAGLYFLDFMAETGKTPSQLVDYLYSKVGPHYYDRRDFHISVAKRQAIVRRLSSSPPATVAGSRVTRMDTTDDTPGWFLISFRSRVRFFSVLSENRSCFGIYAISRKSCTP